MPVQLDPRIISSAVGPDVPLNDLGQVFNNAAMFRQHQAAADANDENIRQKNALNDAYQKATRPDGSIDNGVLQSSLAASRAGAQIPGIQKTNSDLLKSNAEAGERISVTEKNNQEGLYKGLSLVNNTIASLAARPDANDKMVYAEMGNLVNAGAFDIQAKHQGVTPDAYAKDLLSTMPVGDPAALRPWLIQQGAKTADATERLKLSLPKYDEQARGGTINQGTIDPMTGQRTAGVGPAQNPVMTQTPDSMASNATTRRGQDMVDARAKADQGVAANPKQQENIAQMIADGRMAPLSGPALRTSDGLAIMSRVAELNPQYRGQNYAATAKAQNDFNGGKNGNTIRSFNVGLSHLDTLSQLADAMGNNDTQAVNKIGNFFSQQSGGPAVTNFDTAKKVVADEVVKAIVGSGGGVHDRDVAAASIMASNSPAQLKGSIQTYQKLMHGQLDGLEQQYKSSTGLNDFNKYLSPEAQAGRPRSAPVPATGGISPAPAAAPRAGAGGRPSIDSFFH